MKLPADRQLLHICHRIAAVGIVLCFLLLHSVITIGWRGYLLNFPQSITGDVPSGFPVIVGRHPDSHRGVGDPELVTWGEWKRQTQGPPYLWVWDGALARKAHLASGQTLFYAFRMTKLAPQRYMVDVTVGDLNDGEERAQYRVEGTNVIPLTFRRVSDAQMAAGVSPLSLVLTVLLFWSLRAFLRWYTRHTGGEQEIRELLSQARYTLSLIVGYYVFLAIRRASRLVLQPS